MYSPPITNHPFHSEFMALKISIIHICSICDENRFEAEHDARFGLEEFLIIGRNTEVPEGWSHINKDMISHKVKEGQGNFSDRVACPACVSMLQE